MDNKRIENLNFHVKHNDYFGTLATVLDLLRQDQNKKLENLRDDLMYLQANCKINRRGGKIMKNIKAPKKTITLEFGSDEFLDSFHATLLIINSECESMQARHNKMI